MTEIPRQFGHDPAGVEGHAFLPLCDPATMTCPKCLQPVSVFIVGCRHCVGAVALLYAAHLATEHPEFVSDIKAAMA